MRVYSHLYCLALLAVAQWTQAQTSVATAGATPPVLAPGSPVGAYALDKFDTVNLYSGHLNISIPLTKVGGRGEVGYQMVANVQRLWEIESTWNGGYYNYDALDFRTTAETFNRSISYEYAPGAVFGRAAGDAGTTECGGTSMQPPTSILQHDDVRSTITFLSADGTENQLFDTKTNGQPIDITCAGTPRTDRGNTFRSLDGSNLLFVSDTVISDSPQANGFSPSGYLYFPNGTRYRVDGSFISWMADRNGNRVSFHYNSIFQLDQITDALGRTINISYGDLSSGSCDQISVPGISNPVQVCKELNNSSNSPTSQQLFGSYSPGTSQYNPVVVRRIILPDGSQYKFEYNGYGETSKITLPTGGVVEYEHGAGDPAQDPSGVLGSYEHPAVYRRLLRRVSKPNGSTVEGSTEYHPALATIAVPGDNYIKKANIVTEVVKDQNGNALLQRKHYYYGAPNDPAFYYPGPFDLAPWREGLEYQTETWDATGNTLLKTINNAWAQRPCQANDNCPGPSSYQNGPASFDPRITETDTYLGDTGQSNGVAFEYDRYNNIVNQREFDWSNGGTPGGLLRQTLTTYLWSSSPSYAQPGAWLVSLPQSRKICNASQSPTCGSSYTAWTQWLYDEGSPTEAAGIVGHDGVFDQNYHLRGNVTTKLDWAGVDTVNAANQTIGTVMTYDIAGNVVIQQDPNHHATTFSYNDDASGKYAFPTQITNALQQSASARYNYDIGKPTYTTDVNNATTTYSYDSSGRVNGSVDATGARTTVQYPVFDGSGSTQLPYTIDVYRDTDGVSEHRLHTATLYDGMGREAETRTYEAGSYIATTETYDVLGRVTASTNPSRPGDGLGLASRYAYDALGRVVSVTAADNTSTTTSYSGNWTTTTDQAGLSKSMSRDALGRITSVVENPGGQNLVTSYSFDALGDLTQVHQSNQTRTFSYDGLGRLSWSNQPENGAINYRYDAVGNVVWRDDNLGQETCYSYDSLNRIAQKAYYQGSVADGQNGNCGAIPAGNLLASTPPVNYFYGTDSSVFNVGRLIAIANSSSETDFGYDPVGRVVAETQITNGQRYSLSYGYNRAGSLTAQLYPSGRLVNTAYDQANRATAVSGSWLNQPSSYLSNAVYAPHGALQSYAYGNGLAVLNAYNARLQPIERTDTLASAPGCGGASQAAYTGQNHFLLNTTFYWGYPTSQSEHNNGSLRGELTQSCVAGAAFNTWQTFAYDSLNRLTQMTDNGGGNSAQSFTYDAYGNRFYDAANSGGSLPVSPLLPTAGQVDGNNHLTSPGAAYDGAGNLTAMGTGAIAETMSYDAEGKIVSVTSGGVTTTYGYDGSGQRVRKDSNGNTTVYVYDALGALAAEYSNVAATIPCRTCYLSVDHLGSTRMMTDQNGQVVARHDYLAFGEEIGAGYAGRPNNSVWGGVDGIRQKFTGKERDAESGLDYFGARYYGSALGRFTSPDWSDKIEPVPYAELENPQTLNRYTYARNNPLSRTDADGHCSADGEDHGWLWCAAHSVGLVQTQKEQADYARQALSQMHGFTVGGQSPQDFAKNATNQQAIQGLRSADSYIARQAFSPCSPGVACGVIVPPGMAGEAGAVESAEAEAIEVGAQSDFINITKKGSVANIQTNVSAADFGQNLEANGFTRTTASDGTPIYTKGNTQYTVYPKSNSTGGPTAQVKINGAVVEKIRLQ